MAYNRADVDNLRMRVDYDKLTDKKKFNGDLSEYYAIVREINPKTHRYRQTLFCLLCDKVQTPRIWDMKDHIRNHLQLKPYACSKCNKGFNKKSNRDRHVRIANCEDEVDEYEEQSM